MVQRDVRPFLLRDYKVTIGNNPGDEYEKHISTLTLTPSSSSVEWKGAHRDATFQFMTPATWSATLTYAQDWGDPKSLSRFLFDSEGRSIPLEFTPATDRASTKWSMQVMVTPGAVGGDVGSVGVASVTLAIVGRPVPTAVAAPATTP